jgi:D-alanyl-lipoteichoic acid acyltransferase DltB (MBOAT superfamily)
MLFSSLIFLIGFLPLTIGVYFLIPKRCKLRNFFLTIMSLFFYAWGEPRFVLAMIVSIIVNYLFALIIDHQRNNEKNKKIIIAATVLFNLSYLFVFKYLDFAIHTLSVMIGRDEGVSHARAILRCERYWWKLPTAWLAVESGTNLKCCGNAKKGIPLKSLPTPIAPTSDCVANTIT